MTPQQLTWTPPNLGPGTSTHLRCWQSLYKMPKQFFEDYGAVIGDEAHLFKAKSLTTLMNKLVSTPYRVGTTGTLDGTKTHRLVLEGVFGQVHKVTTTKKLMDDKQLANLKIVCCMINWKDAHRKEVKGMTYQEEIDWIVTHPDRNEIIKNLTIAQDGNTLVLFQYVEKHGVVSVSYTHLTLPTIYSV